MKAQEKKEQEKKEQEKKYPRAKNKFVYLDPSTHFKLQSFKLSRHEKSLDAAINRLFSDAGWMQDNQKTS